MGVQYKYKIGYSQQINNKFEILSKMSRLQLSEYQLFATVNQNSINLEEEGLYILEQYDFCMLVTLQGNSSFLEEGNPTIISRMKNKKSIYISKSPIFSSHLKRYILFLRIWEEDQKALGIAHAFCTLMSHVTVVCGYQNTHLSYLLSPRTLIKQLPKTPPQTLLILTTQDPKSATITQSTQHLKQILNSQQVPQQQLSKIYKQFSAYSIPANSSAYSNFYHLLESLTENLLKLDTVLIHGEVVSCFAIVLAEQYKQGRVMCPAEAEEQIQVDQYFEEYLTQAEKYNNKCKNSLNPDGNGDIEGQLKRVRAEIEGDDLWSRTPHYSKKIGRYMDRKQQQLTNLNQQYSDSHNLNLLQKESSKSLQNLSSLKNATQADITKQINRLMGRYNQKSRGENRHKLLAQFLQVFVPTMYTQSGINSQQVDKKIDGLVKDNKKLEEQVTKLQKKSGKCCQIM